MKPRPVLWLAVLAAAARLAPAPVLAQDMDDFGFFEREAEIVTASRLPQPLSRSPATVYVVSAEDIKASGAQTLWDALRAVPGVDVMSGRTSHGDVGIRGMNKTLNNRVLVLLDGRTVLNGFFDNTVWENIPVTLEEVERIEVVEGPASALYGGNAMHGVINIITKTPEQLRGPLLSVTQGERKDSVLSALFGRRKGPASYKVGLGRRSVDMFGDASRQASAVAKAHGWAGWDFGAASRLSLSAGIADHDVQINSGPSYDSGSTQFLRTDFSREDARARFFWNRGRVNLRDNPLLFNLQYDTYDLSVENSLELPGNNTLTAGTSWRRNTASSSVFAPGQRRQDLYAIFFEDVCLISERWTAALSLRGDEHPFTNWQLSPRGSLIFQPVPAHSLRFTAAEAFRNPTLLENYIDLTVRQGAVTTAIVPAPYLEPERMRFFELAHRGDFGRWKTGAAAFFYRVTHLVGSRSETVPAPPPNVRTLVINAGETKAYGGELGVEGLLKPGLSAFVNYSLQTLEDQLGTQTTHRSAPRHKANAGLRAREGPWTFNAVLHSVGHTRWSVGATPIRYAGIDGYTMVNVRAGYEFAGRLEGLEAAVSGFNITGKHFEILPRQSAALAGQNGEIVLPRWSATLSYRFGP